MVREHTVPIVFRNVISVEGAIVFANFSVSSFVPKDLID